MVTQLTDHTENALIDCPACGGWYVAGTTCECGYCPHLAGAGNTCVFCGETVEPTMPELVAELLAAADCVLVELAVTPAFFSMLTAALPALAEPVARLRQIVTQIQGTAGLRVVEVPRG